MPGEVSFRIADYGNEKSTHKVRIPAITAANFAAFLDAGGFVPDYYDALDDIVIGNIQQERIVANVIDISTAPAGSVWAQREMKWLVSYRDTVDPTQPHYQLEIACPDLTLLVAGTDLMNVSAGAGAAFVAAFEALVVSDAGNAVEVLTVQLVGRNL